MSTLPQVQANTIWPTPVSVIHGTKARKTLESTFSNVQYRNGLQNCFAHFLNNHPKLTSHNDRPGGWMCDSFNFSLKFSF